MIEEDIRTPTSAPRRPLYQAVMNLLLVTMLRVGAEHVIDQLGD